MGRKALDENVGSTEMRRYLSRDETPTAAASDRQRRIGMPEEKGKRWVSAMAGQRRLSIVSHRATLLYMFLGRSGQTVLASSANCEVNHGMRIILGSRVVILRTAHRSVIPTRAMALWRLLEPQ